MPWLLIAAIATLLVAGMHTIAGERMVIGPLLRSPDLPRLTGSVESTRNLLRWAWHFTSLAWVGFAVVLFLLRDAHPDARLVIGRTVSAVLAVYGLITLIGSRGRHPAWPLFLVAALSGWVGSAASGG